MFSNQSNVTLSFSGNENYNAPLISQGLEEYSRDLGVKRNTVRYSGKRKIACRVKSLTGKRDSQKPWSGMREPWSGMRDRDDRSSGSGEIWRDAIFVSQPLISYLASERHVVNMGLLDANQILKIYRFLDRFRPVMSSGFWYRRPLQLKRGAGSKFSRLISSRAFCSTCQGKKAICQIKWKLSRICSMRKGGTMSNQKKVISFRSNQTRNESHRRVVLSA